jgi:hypothetical protein
VVTLSKVNQAIILVVTANNIYEFSDGWRINHVISYNSVKLTLVFDYAPCFRSTCPFCTMLFLNKECWCIP